MAYEIKLTNGENWSYRNKESFAHHACYQYDRVWFEDGHIKLYHTTKNNETEIDIEELENWLEEKESAKYAKKCETHKEVYINTGVCAFSKNHKKIWVKK